MLFPLARKLFPFSSSEIPWIHCSAIGKAGLEKVSHSENQSSCSQFLGNGGASSSPRSIPICPLCGGRWPDRWEPFSSRQPWKQVAENLNFVLKSYAWDRRGELENVNAEGKNRVSVNTQKPHLTVMGWADPLSPRVVLARLRKIT